MEESQGAVRLPSNAIILTLTLALACPGLDYMRLWPLPVEQPWQETPDPLPDPWPDRYAWR